MNSTTNLFSVSFGISLCVINDDDHDGRSRNHAFCRHDVRASFHNPHDGDDAPHDRVCHDDRDDPHRNVLYHGGPSSRDDPRDGRNDGVPPSCDDPPFHDDARDDRHASHDGHPCDNHHRTCVPCGTRPYGTCDGNHGSFRPSCGPCHARISIPCVHVRARGGYRAHHVHHDDPSYGRRVRHDDPRDALYHDGRVRLLHDDDGPYDPCGPLHHVLHGDGNDVRGHHHVHGDVHDDDYRPFPDLPLHLAPKTWQRRLRISWPLLRASVNLCI